MDVVKPDGELVQRTQGTPQGGLISSLVANIFLDLGFDKWMQDNFSCINYERYADDIVVHCRSRKQLEFVERKIRLRLAKCKLELCPDKTKIVYCKDSNRSGNYSSESFDFFGYRLRPRSVRNSNGKFFVSFSPAVSCKALKAIRSKIKKHRCN